MKDSKEKRPKLIGLLFSDVKREYFPTEEQYVTEKDANKDAETVSNYVKDMGIRCNLYAGNKSLPNLLKTDRPTMVFNLVDSIRGSEALSATIPSLLELLEIPYTGADPLGKALDTNKFLVKNLLQQAGVPVPNFQLLHTHTDQIDSQIRFPIISKLNEIHGAVEISHDAISENEKHLRERVKYLTETYRQAVIIEEFIVGKEVTCMLLEGLNRKVYHAEKIFKGADTKYKLATFDIQWDEESPDTFFYSKYEDPILREYVKKAFETAKMADYGKFDVRIDSSGRYYFIDANCNPAFGPKELNCALATILDLYGISFPEILKRLILNTLS